MNIFTRMIFGLILKIAVIIRLSGLVFRSEHGSVATVSPAVYNRAMRFALYGFKNDYHIAQEDNFLAELVDIGWGWLEVGYDTWLYDRETERLTPLRVMIRMDLYEASKKTQI